ncbi:MAG: MarR family winged helix-turn-helix transcriptional regulator [Clostridium sp.]|nr:MarR family winged helix-turn-helix transcriptional regulator [Clostridium sp.]
MGFDGERKPLGFTLREIHNLTKILLHKMHPPCQRPGTPLTQLQGGILGYLYHHDAAEPVYQKNIEEVFRISRATATNTLQVMEKNGLIVRKVQDRDARLKRIFMTEEACREHMQMEKRMEELDAYMLAGMSREETEQFLMLLDRVRENLERMNRECGGQQNQQTKREAEKHVTNTGCTDQGI